VEITAAFIAEALNEGDFTVLDDFAHPDIGDLSEPRIFRDGVAGLRAALTAVRTRMPDVFARISDIRPGDVGSVAVELDVTGTYAGDPMAPTARDGAAVRWTQYHLWFFQGDKACSHLGRVDRAAIERTLGPRF
jgi:predicted ester cyclase